MPQDSPAAQAAAPFSFGFDQSRFPDEVAAAGYGAGVPDADHIEVEPPLPKLSATWSALRQDPSLRGRAWSQAARQATDDWLVEAFGRAVAGATARTDRSSGGWRGRRERGAKTSVGADTLSTEGLALMAVGSLGRGDLAPASDLDLLLVHSGRSDVVEIADRLWYPIWDDPMPLDHSVRTLAQVEQAAEADLRVSQGLLDVRFIAGEAELGAKVVVLGQRLWSKRVTRWLPEVLVTRESAWAEHGDVAFLLEPELQEGRGGLRDLQVLSLMSTVTPVVAGVATNERLAQAADLLHSVRVELQRQGGRRADRLMLEDQERVAEALGLGGREDVAYEVAQAGRTVAWVVEDAFRRARSWLAGPGGRAGSADRALGPGLVLRDKEVVVPIAFDVGQDPTLALRAATASAELGVPTARPTMARLAAEAPPPPNPWPETVTRAFVDLLAAGGPAVHAIETLDQFGIWERYLPEWPNVRNRPQFNPYHRWSVDRHLLEAVASAAGHLREVGRPDLLLLGALFHDIGKGQPGDHSEVGAAIAAEAVARIGVGPEDAAVLERVVRLHLLLPEVATRRDLDDPATVRAVVQAVQDECTLEVLAALAAADGSATGSSAWSDWKANLVADLARRARDLMAGRPLPAGLPFPSGRQRELLAQGGLQVHVTGHELTVVAPDRAGLFSDVAGALSLHDLGVLEARVHSEEGQALEVFTLEVPDVAAPRWERVSADIEAAADGRLNVADALARRPPPRRPRRARAPVDPRTRVLVDNKGASTATIVEVRAPDSPGALHKITAVMAQLGLDIVSARVATLGGAVVDTFYVCSAEGKIEPDDALEQLCSALEAELSGVLTPPKS